MLGAGGQVCSNIRGKYEDETVAIGFVSLTNFVYEEVFLSKCLFNLFYYVSQCENIFREKLKKNSI